MLLIPNLCILKLDWIYGKKFDMFYLDSPLLQKRLLSFLSCCLKPQLFYTSKSWDPNLLMDQPRQNTEPVGSLTDRRICSSPHQAWCHQGPSLCLIPSSQCFLRYMFPLKYRTILFESLAFLDNFIPCDQLCSLIIV